MRLTRLRDGPATAASALLPIAAIVAACTPTPNRTIPEGLQEVQAVTVLKTPQPRPEALDGPDAAQIKHGRYLVELIGCGACHTDGAIIGEPDAGRLLAGSRVGIAYTSPLHDKYPGVVYPPNLTPVPCNRSGLMDRRADCGLHPRGRTSAWLRKAHRDVLAAVPGDV